MSPQAWRSCPRGRKQRPSPTPGAVTWHCHLCHWEGGEGGFITGGPGSEDGNDEATRWRGARGGVAGTTLCPRRELGGQAEPEGRGA